MRNLRATYEATELINPKSIFSGKKPSIKESEHLFFDVAACSDNLQKWIKETKLQSSVKNKIQEWFIDGLKPWDISRDAPYFGLKYLDTMINIFMSGWMPLLVTLRV